jgi:S1-C subfamily serine protease
MKGVIEIGLLAVLLTSLATAQELKTLPQRPQPMERSGKPLDNTARIAPLNFNSKDWMEVDDTLPTSELSHLADSPITEAGGQNRSARDAEIYRAAAPSVVLIITKGGLGSGSLVSTSGDVLTNWHVVKGYADVGVVFKPSVEGRKPTREDIRVAHVIKYDEIADLALLKVADPLTSRIPIRLGDIGDISVGADVHAIGHPTGEAWTYTKGVISQYRQGYEWLTKGTQAKHTADVIQTQTPINPGSSGGPLISDSGGLIGVNSFKSSGEGLNFAISVGEIRRFLTRSGNRTAPANVAKQQKRVCEPKEVFRSRNKENDAVVIGYDINCGGKANAEYVIPDKSSEAIKLRADRNEDGLIDVIFFDFKRQGRWDLSFWDEKFEGHWTLVGYHSDGTMKPTSFESWAAFQTRLAAQ